MIEPLIKTVDVPCDQETAFKVFVEEMHTWWPLGKFTISAMSGGAAKTVRVEPKVGGQIVEIGPNDEEYLWGQIKSYDPHDFFAMDFHIPTPDEAITPDQPLDVCTLVEVSFKALEDGLTHVELKQSNFEGLGPRGEDIRGGYTHGLEMIICQAYKAACDMKGNCTG